MLAFLLQYYSIVDDNNYTYAYGYGPEDINAVCNLTAPLLQYILRGLRKQLNQRHRYKHSYQREQNMLSSCLRLF